MKSGKQIRLWGKWTLLLMLLALCAAAMSGCSNADAMAADILPRLGLWGDKNVETERIAVTGIMEEAPDGDSGEALEPADDSGEPDAAPTPEPQQEGKHKKAKKSKISGKKKKLKEAD